MQNYFLDERVMIKDIDQFALFVRITSWLSSEGKELRIIEKKEPVYIKFMYEKDLGFLEGFGNPFMITLSRSGADVEVRVQVPFPRSLDLFQNIEPLITNMALEDIYKNIGVELTDDLLKRVYPKRVLKGLISNSIGGTIALSLVAFTTLCAFIYAFGLQYNGGLGYMIVVLALLSICFAAMVWYAIRSNSRYSRYKSLLKQLYG